MRIMIVEDDQVIRRLLAKQILSWGYEIFTCQNFTDIMQEFDQINPHLVLLDINLPSYNGYYWCQEIRQSSKVPIIFISSRSDNMDQIMAMQMGADDFVVKPFDIPLLITKIQALLRRTYDFQINQSTQVILHGISLNLGKSQLESKSSKVDLTKGVFLVIYFKQISEGQQDRDNYQIMQAIGLGQQTIKKAINKQIIWLFLLPLLVALIHMTVSSTIIFNILGLINVRDWGQFITSYLLVIVFFSLVYGFIYWLTSRTYCQIVSQAK